MLLHHVSHCDWANGLASVHPFVSRDLGANALFLVGGQRADFIGEVESD
jgi:hypothetical protein